MYAPNIYCNTNYNSQKLLLFILFSALITTASGQLVETVTSYSNLELLVEDLFLFIKPHILSQHTHICFSWADPITTQMFPTKYLLFKSSSWATYVYFSWHPEQQTALKFFLCHFGSQSPSWVLTPGSCWSAPIGIPASQAPSSQFQSPLSVLFRGILPSFTPLYLWLCASCAQRMSRNISKQKMSHPSSHQPLLPPPKVHLRGFRMEEKRP